MEEACRPEIPLNPFEVGFSYRWLFKTALKASLRVKISQSCESAENHLPFILRHTFKLIRTSARGGIENSEIVFIWLKYESTQIRFYNSLKNSAEQICQQRKTN